jgi:hypothetical protein
VDSEDRHFGPQGNPASQGRGLAAVCLLWRLRIGCLLVTLPFAGCRVQGEGLVSAEPAVQADASGSPRMPPPPGGGAGGGGEGAGAGEGAAARDAGAPLPDAGGLVATPPSRPDASGPLPGPDANPPFVPPEIDAAPLPPLPALAVGLVLWLPFDETMGASARDESGERNRVRLYDLDGSTAWVPGRTGGAIDFTSAQGGTGHLRAENSPSINAIGSELTIGVWVSRGRGQTGVIVSRRATAIGYALYRLEVTNNDRLRLVLNDRPGVRLSLQSATPLPADAWVHVAITSDRDQARLYIDGQPAGSAVYGVPIATDVSPVVIGAAEGEPAGALTGFLPGRLDELFLYQRALTQAEVAALASGVRPRSPALPP